MPQETSRRSKPLSVICFLFWSGLVSEQSHISTPENVCCSPEGHSI